MRMLRLAAATTATVMALLGTAANTAVAQSPSPEPPPWFGGRVEMPEHGFAVTAPDGWVAFDTTGDVDEQARRAASVPGPISEEFVSTTIVALALRNSQRKGMQLTIIGPGGSTNCQFAVPPGDLPDLDQVAASLHAGWSVDDTTTHLEVPKVVELPAGPTRLITMGGMGYTSEWESAFYVGSGASTFVVVCVGTERPDDDWLSIAETFEFLPAE